MLPPPTIDRHRYLFSMILVYEVLRLGEEILFYFSLYIIITVKILNISFSMIAFISNVCIVFTIFSLHKTLEKEY